MPTEHSASATPSSPTPTRSNLQTLAMPLAVVIAGGLIAGAVFFSSKDSSGAVAQKKIDVKDVEIQSYNPTIGDKNAPVTLAYWFDYQCPYCKAIDVGHEQIPIEPSFPILMEEYVKTGKLRVVFKDYAFLGPDSETAALYKHAVWELYPEKFYEWHETMMHAQDEEHGGFGDEVSIVKLSGTIAGIDGSALKAKVAEKREVYLGYIAADRDEGSEKFGIGGTPAIVTGKTLIPGADSPSSFRAAIDAQL
jgi:protein-disulfide isomerase